jgi:hypothetical protein
VKDKHVTWLKQKTAQHSMPSKLPVQTGITGFFTSEFDHAKLKIEDDRYTDCRGGYSIFTAKNMAYHTFNDI